jgi:N-acetylglutamate synthase-like GNAT family acetyltransferase
VPIRAATIKDTPQITALLHQLGYPDTEQAVHRRLEMLAGRADTIILVAEDHGRQLTGCIQVVIANRLAEGPYGEIASLVVAEDQRGRGVGRQLVESAADWLNGHGLSRRMRVRCNTIRKQTHRFYAHLGFRETKSQKIFDRDLPGPGIS